MMLSLAFGVSCVRRGKTSISPCAGRARVIALNRSSSARPPSALGLAFGASSPHKRISIKRLWPLNIPSQCYEAEKIQWRQSQRLGNMII